MCCLNVFLQNHFSLSGQEGLIGIPGTIGGAIYTNASSYSSCISDYLTKLEYINSKGEIIVLEKEKLQFKWRYSTIAGEEQQQINTKQWESTQAGRPSDASLH